MAINYSSRNPIKIVFILFYFQLTLLAGCREHYSYSDLKGKYVLSIDKSIDIIELAENKKYIHTYITKSGQFNSQSGTWKIENLESGPTISLDEFESFSQNKLNDKSTYLLLIGQSFGKIKLISNIDINEGYERTP